MPPTPVQQRQARFTSGILQSLSTRNVKVHLIKLFEALVCLFLKAVVEVVRVSTGRFREPGGSLGRLRRREGKNHPLMTSVVKL